jgi:predicted nucleotidyltransferase
MATIDLKQLHETIETWAKSAIEGYEAKAVYLFGSLIHKGGAQFNESSDVDLVVVMPTIADAVDRLRWIEAFASAKGDLELQLMRILKKSATEPAASVVAVTELELSFNIHKDGHREFFTANTFRDLVTGDVREGLPGAVAVTGCRFVAAGLAFAQKMRNEFYAVSANLTPRLEGYDGPEPLPKRIMRAAAMAARAAGKSSGPGAEHDVQEGLDLLTSELYRRRDDHAMYFALQDRLSVRRQARGRREAMEAADQLLLGEIIYDVVSGVAAEPTRSGSGGGESGAHPPIEHSRSGTAVITPDESAGGSQPVRQLTAEPFGSTTAFFADRFAAAFPGVRSISWHDVAEDVEQRMMRLLRDPLSFSNGHPVWWWRGGNLQIQSFRKLSDGIYLMNSDELRITRVAAVPGSTYQRSFVYVEADGMSRTGLYPTRSADVAATRSTVSYRTGRSSLGTNMTTEAR